jgi:cell division protein FtsI/penicillin-binding protein 2
MVAIRRLAFAVLVVLFAGSPASRSQTQSSGSLFAQSARKVLAREFTAPGTSYILLDARSGEVIVQRWDNADNPIPLGSLVKPFTALAYGEQHAYQYPVHICRGKATGCWFPRGHGKVDLTRAIAYSCNSYFRVLTSKMLAADVAPVARSFDLQLPPSGTAGPPLAGLGTNWKISPLQIARAYAELMRRREQPGVRQILAGMAQSARQGTGAEVDRTLPYPYALVKTGTSVCTHKQRAGGDGFTVAIAPSDHPQVVLLVRVHGVPGHEAARVAGEMLRRIGA